MKAGRLFQIVFCVMFLIAFFPCLTAYADENSENTDSEVLIVNTAEEFVEAAADSSLKTIELGDDISLDDINSISINGSNKTIDGKGHHLTTASSLSITVNDGSIDISNCNFDTEGNSNINFQYGGSVKGIHGSKINITSSGKLTVTDSELQGITIQNSGGSSITESIIDYIYVDNSNGTVLRDVQLVVPDACTGITINDPSATIEDVNIQGGFQGIHATQTFNGTINLRNVSISGCTGDGIYNHGSVNGSQLYLSDVSITDVGGHAIYCTGSNSSGYVRVMEGSTLELDSEKIAVYLKKGGFHIGEGASITESRALYTVFCDVNSSVSDSADCLTLVRESGAGKYYDVTGKDPVSLENNTAEVSTEDEFIAALSDEDVYVIEIKNDISISSSLKAVGELKRINGNEKVIEFSGSKSISSDDYLEMNDIEFSSTDNGYIYISLNSGGSLENVKGPVNVSASSTVMVDNCEAREININSGPQSRIENTNAWSIHLDDSSNSAIKNVNLIVPESCTGIDLSGAGSCAIEDVTITGGNIGIWASSSNYRSATLKNVTIKDCAGDGIYNHGGVNGCSLSLSDVSITNVGGHAIYCTGTNSNGSVMVMSGTRLELDSQKIAVYLKKGSFSIDEGAEIVESKSLFTVFCDINSRVTDSADCLTLVRESGAGKYYDVTGKDPVSLENNTAEVSTEDEFIAALSDEDVYVIEIKNDISISSSLKAVGELKRINGNEKVIEFSGSKSISSDDYLEMNDIEFSSTDNGYIYISLNSGGSLENVKGPVNVSASSTVMVDNCEAREININSGPQSRIENTNAWSIHLDDSSNSAIKNVNLIVPESCTGIDLSGAGSCAIEDVTITGGNIGIWASSSNYRSATLKNVTIKDCAGDGIYNHGGVNGCSLSLSDVSITNVGGHAIYCTGTKSRGFVRVMPDSTLVVESNNTSIQLEKGSVSIDGYLIQSGSEYAIIADSNSSVSDNNKQLILMEQDETSSKYYKTRANYNDIEPPVITLVGEETITIPYGSEYEDEGAIVTDNLDEELELIVENNVDYSKEGEYAIVYKAIDSHNNVTEISRTVVVTHAPVMVERVEPTCLKTGNIEYYTCSGCGLLYAEQSCITQITPDETIIPAAGHTFAEDFTVDKESSCTEAGSMSRHCVNCEAVCDETVIPQKAHTYGEWTTTKEPTCIESGSKERVCSVCGEVETATIDATGHDWAEEYTVDKEPTCTEEGEQSIHCKTCGEKKPGSTVAVVALGHTYGEWVVKVQPTCTEAGSKERVCSVCGVVETATIDATGHDWAEEYTVDKEPTCTEEGEQSIHCKTCGEKKPDSTVSIAALGHSYGEWTTTKEPTCTESGSKERVCSVCSEVETATIDAMGHEWAEELTVDKESSCTEYGSMSRHCVNCEAVCDEIVIPKKAHTYDEWVVKARPTCTEPGRKERVCSVCGDVETATIDATGHDWAEEYTVDKEPTCTEEGEQSIHCKTCGEKKPGSTVVVAALGHTYGEWVVKVQPTCTESGSKERVCSVCGDVETATIDATGHDWAEEYTVDKEPTCTEAGVKSIHCTVCGEKKPDSEEVIEALGHTYGEWTVVKEPTCTEPGSKERKCTACGESETAEIAATGHGWSEEYTVDKEPTCTEAGVKSIHCNVCGEKKPDSEEVIEALGHAYGEWTVVKEPTCTEPGSKERKCTVCGETETAEIAATGHGWSEEYTVDKEPTCTEAGVKSIHCTVCGEKKPDSEEEIEALGHTYGEWTVVKEPTCTEPGSKECKCTVCGETETAAIDATGHDWAEEYTVDKEPTCTEAGVKSIHCTVCGEKKPDSEEVIEALGHAYGEWTVVKEPTCTEPGSKERKCTVCGETETAAIDATGHDWAEEYTVDKEPTCTEAGVKSIHCTVCGEKKPDSEEVIEALGHAYGEWTVVKEPTCTEPGSKECKCTVCGETETAEIAAIGHGWSEEYTVDKEPTCTEAGVKSIHCNVCGEKKPDSEEVIEATGHDWSGEYTVDKEPTYTEEGSESLHCIICGTKKEGTERAIAVLPIPVDDAKVTLPHASMTYTGKALTQEPTVEVTFNGETKTLTKDTDYTVSYKNNINVGTATVIITGKGNYTGTVLKTFQIKAASGWVKEDGNWYYYNASGVKTTGWQKIGGVWYYMNSAGVMQTGWEKIGGRWYYFNSSGAMQTGWQKISGSWYYFNSSGSMGYSEWRDGYWLNANGTWTYQPKGSWKKSGGRWWFGDTSGWYAKNTTIWINGSKYSFDASGWLK